MTTSAADLHQLRFDDGETRGVGAEVKQHHLAALAADDDVRIGAGGHRDRRAQVQRDVLQLAHWNTVRTPSRWCNSKTFQGFSRPSNGKNQGCFSNKKHKNYRTTAPPLVRSSREHGHMMRYLHDVIFKHFNAIFTHFDTLSMCTNINMKKINWH